MKRETHNPPPPANSPLQEIPSPEEILRRIYENAAENRNLRALYRIAQRVSRRQRDEVTANG